MKSKSKDFSRTMVVRVVTRPRVSLLSLLINSIRAISPNLPGITLFTNWFNINPSKLPFRDGLIVCGKYRFRHLIAFNTPVATITKIPKPITNPFADRSASTKSLNGIS